MNDNHVPLGARRGLSPAADTRAAPDRHITKARHVVAIDGRRVAPIEATELMALADMPDTAVVLGSRRGHRSESAVNRDFAATLRLRPEEAGVVGSPVVLGVESLHREPGRRGGEGRLGLAGVQCIEGFQRLVTIAHLARELPPEVPARAVLRVAIVAGEDRDRIRELCDEAAHRLDPLVPRDDLARCPRLLVVREESQKEGGYVDPRRGILAGPHPVGWTDLIHDRLPAETDRIAHLLIASYERLRGSNHVFESAAPELDLWLELARRPGPVVAVTAARGAAAPPNGPPGVR
ncbi:hypothetical protein ACFYUY_32520 [Kitasatospora sp. NPDC004745]|uniref:hypothetical protein n=1 Tax=Kitasatospora sp. NPDC004745 TaxID=3364019 RepID=UPI0036C7B342